MHRLIPAHGPLASALGIVLLCAWSVGASAQIPDTFTNLKVLPKDVSKGELVSQMRQFAGALGVRCNFCHVGENVETLEGFDWASDEKPEKKAARVMMRMTQAINADYTPKIGSPVEDRVMVECMTCHRGQERPVLIADVLKKSEAEGGIEAVKAKYKELREEYYGRATYDFGEFVLPGLAEENARAGKMDDANALLDLNLEYFPESSYSRVMKAQIVFQQGDKDGAIALLEKAVELDPENNWAKRMLEKMKK